MVCFFSFFISIVLVGTDVGAGSFTGVGGDCVSFTLIVGLEKVKPDAVSLIRPSRSLTDSVEMTFVPPSLSMETVAEIGASLKP